MNSLQWYGPGFLYLARSGRYHKIGMSGNPILRLQTLRAPDGPIELLHVIPTTGMKPAEDYLHAQVSSFRADLQGYGREWYCLDEKTLDWIRSLPHLTVCRNQVCPAPFNPRGDAEIHEQEAARLEAQASSLLWHARRSREIAESLKNFHKIIDDVLTTSIQ